MIGADRLHRQRPDRRVAVCFESRFPLLCVLVVSPAEFVTGDKGLRALLEGRCLLRGGLRRLTLLLPCLDRVNAGCDKAAEPLRLFARLDEADSGVRA